ncbi:hypothetical protein [Brevibacterium sp. CFH 10365]|uniref:hypothetical protein n=1 Tax=Brevibacterium sp. CFH 10365 TaxID=2585207 RepID=UPI0012665D84|nr:hypothetical protein [Brevibacterium sp. CFH 10365]
MTICDTCGNDYEQTFTLSFENESWNFDSFECAIHKAAPTCEHCGCRILGHGVHDGESVFCCSHCAREAGLTEATDDKGGSR